MADSIRELGALRLQLDQMVEAHGIVYGMTGFPDAGKAWADYWQQHKGATVMQGKQWEVTEGSMSEPAMAITGHAGTAMALPVEPAPLPANWAEGIEGAEPHCTKCGGTAATVKRCAECGIGPEPADTPLPAGAEAWCDRCETAHKAPRDAECDRGAQPHLDRAMAELARVASNGLLHVEQGNVAGILRALAHGAYNAGEAEGARRRAIEANADLARVEQDLLDQGKRDREDGFALGWRNAMASVRQMTVAAIASVPPMPDDTEEEQ